MKMKLVVFLLGVAMLTQVCLPKRAEAGVGIAVLGGAFALAFQCVDEDCDGSDIVLIPVILGGLTALVGYGAGAMSVGLLDADGGLGLAEMDRWLSSQYPFLDNADSRAALSTALRAKVASEISQSGQKSFVSLTEAETRAALSSAELSDEQMQKVIRELGPKPVM